MQFQGPRRAKEISFLNWASGLVYGSLHRYFGKTTYLMLGVKYFHLVSCVILLQFEDHFTWKYCSYCIQILEEDLPIKLTESTGPSTSSCPDPSHDFFPLYFSRTHLLRIHSAASAVLFIYQCSVVCINWQCKPGKCSINIFIGVMDPFLHVHRRASNPLLSDRIAMTAWLLCEEIIKKWEVQCAIQIRDYVCNNRKVG